MNESNNKSVSGAMKLLKISAIGTMLLSVGSTYAFNSDEVFAKTSLDGNDTPSAVQVSDSDYATLTKSLSTYHYNDVRADHYAFSSIEWAAENNLFNDNGEGDFNPTSPVTESELISVIANYFNISSSYDEFAKYQISLNGYNNNDLRSHSAKMGEFAQIVSELTGNQRGNIDDSLLYLNKERVIDVGTITEGSSISDLAGSELLLNKAQLAVLMQKVSNNHLTISEESKEIYNQNSGKSLDELTTSINKDNVVSVANATTTSKESEITTVSKSTSDDTPTFVITPGKSSDTNITPEQKEKLKKSDEEHNHRLLIEKNMEKIEKEHAPVKGAKIKDYFNVAGKTYVKNNKVYEYYKIYWTKTSKFSYVGIPIRKASSFDIAIYSKSGNHIDSRAKLTSNIKKVIDTLKRSKTYSKKYRYIVVYRSDSVTKMTELYLIPKSGRSAEYEVLHYRQFTYDSTESLTLPNFKTAKEHESNVRTAYNLYILTHRASLKEWQVALGGGYKSNKLFYGYGIIGNNLATKIGK